MTDTCMHAYVYTYIHTYIQVLEDCNRQTEYRNRDEAWFKCKNSLPLAVFYLPFTTFYLPTKFYYLLGKD